MEKIGEKDEASRSCGKHNGDHVTNKLATSDDIVKDLLNDVRQSEKPFSVEDLAAAKKAKEKKKSKEHKHKKSKKKKKHRSKRHHSGARKRSRSRSSSHRKRRRRSRTTSGSSVNCVEKEESAHLEKSELDILPAKSPPVPDRSSVHEVSDEDDLPVGADFRTVMKDAKLKINISSKIGSTIDLAALPVVPLLEKPQSFNAFPLSKPIKKDDDEVVQPSSAKRESDILNKVIAEKGRGDFIPRNLKVKYVSNENTGNQNQGKSDSCYFKKGGPKLPDKCKEESFVEISADEDEKSSGFALSAPPQQAQSSASLASNCLPATEPVSDGELEKEIAEELAAAAQPKNSTRFPKVSRIVECSTAVISKNVCKEKSTRKTFGPSRRQSSSPNTDDEIRIKARTSTGTRSTRARKPSPYRSRGRRRDDRHSRSRSRRRYSRSRSQSRSRDKFRRRSKSRSSTRSKSRSCSDIRCRPKLRRSRSRSSSHSRSRSRSRSHSRSTKSRSRSRSPRRRFGADYRGRPGSGIVGRGKRGRIDKAKLLAIARKKAQKMQLLGISLGSLDPHAQNQPKSVDDFVSYCQQIQRRQEKEDRREKGEAVSSDECDKSGSRVGSPTSFKHPFGVRTAGQSDGIKINIVNATSIPTKTPQERVLDTSQLRLVYPVSSGVTHKENTDKWTPVMKNKPLKTCSDEQKKYVGITSLEAERYRAAASSSTDHLLPPPPAPPVLTGLGGLLPPPPPPPKLTAFDTLLPPPPPLPQLLVLPPEDDMIMHEPDKIEETGSQDVAKVLAQRASAQLKLTTNPNDYDAIRMLKEADDKMASWAAAKNLPGKFTGSTGLNVLSAEELQPHDPRYNAWVKKDMFKNTRPTLGGVGMRLMQKMGWRPGEGLGPDGMGTVEPLVMDVKNDRKGLVSQLDHHAKNSPVLNSSDVSVTKHPVSLLMELCTKRKWAVPTFHHSESGPSNMREFRCSAVVNGIEYQSNVVSRSKKDAKSVACRIVLQSLGLIPRDPTLPVVI